MMERTRHPTCREVVGWTTEWTEDSLDGDRLSLFEGHLEECESCRTFVDQIELTAELTRSWASADTVETGRKEEILQLVLGSALRHEGGAPVASEPSSAESEVSSSPALDGNPCPELDESTARAYLEDRLPARQQIAVLEHLIDGCEPCRLTCAEIAFPEFAGEAQPRVSMREEPPAPELEARYLEELERLASPQHQSGQPRLRDDLEPQRFLLWLIRQGRDLTESDPPKALVVASLAVSLAEDLDIESRVRAAMLKGMVIRKVEGDYTKADRWFALAAKTIREHSLSKRLEGKVLMLWAFSQFSRSRLHQAIALYQQALELYWRIGDLARWAECLMDMTRPIEEIEPTRSISELLRVSSILNWEDDERRAMAMGQYLAGSYLLTEKPERALAAIEMCRRRLLPLNLGRSVSLRLDWTEARIMNLQGEFENAAALPRGVLEEFLRLDLPAFAAFTSFDLSVSLIGLRRWSELAEVAEPMAGFFISRGISGEAAVALGLFRRAITAQTLTIKQVRTLQKRLG